jgi:hypothetical protein
MPPLGYIGRTYLAATTNGTYLPSSKLTLSYRGIDVAPYGTSNIAVYRWDSSANNWVKLSSTVDAISATVAAPLAQAGLYCISAEIIGDTTAPAIAIHAPAAGSTLTTLTTVGVQASDNAGVLRTSFYLNNQCIGVDSNGYNGFTCSYDFSKKPSGQYTLKVVAEDVSGNAGESQITVNIVSQGVAPAVSISSPAAASALEGTVSLSGICADDSLVAGVFICLDGVYVGEAKVSGNNWTYQLDTSLFANGNHTLSAIVMDEDQNTSEQGISVVIAGQTVAGVSDAKTLASGQLAKLTGQVVTFGRPGSNGGFYIEETDRSSGMRVEGISVPAEGSAVSVSGIMVTCAGERVMVGADVLVLSSDNTLPLPVGLSNASLGGGQFGLYAPGITGGCGLHNLGLLVRTWGKITQIGSDYIYIDDGSNLKDGTTTGADENAGVRIICDPAGYNTGDYVNITGISSSFETPSGTIARQVITRRADDVKLSIH